MSITEKLLHKDTSFLEADEGGSQKNSPAVTDFLQTAFACRRDFYRNPASLISESLISATARSNILLVKLISMRSLLSKEYPSSGKATSITKNSSNRSLRHSCVKVSRSCFKFSADSPCIHNTFQVADQCSENTMYLVFHLISVYSVFHYAFHPLILSFQPDNMQRDQQVFDIIQKENVSARPMVSNSSHPRIT